MKLMKLYRYIGPKRIAERIRSQPAGWPVQSVEDLQSWVRDTKQDLSTGDVVATFVVDESGTLLISDRRSEHVVCAGGQSVQSAGEITFHVTTNVKVVGVSNQSTGYCPEPESWPAVAAALSRAGLNGPDDFSLTCVFRRCDKCLGLIIVKNSAFECSACETELPANYNVQ